MSFIICFSDYENTDSGMINNDDINDLLDIVDNNEYDDLVDTDSEQQNEYCEAVLLNIESQCVGDISIFTGKLDNWIILQICFT